MSDNSRESHPFGEDALKQAMSESLHTPPGSEGNNPARREPAEPEDGGGHTSMEREDTLIGSRPENGWREERETDFPEFHADDSDIYAEQQGNSRTPGPKAAAAGGSGLSRIVIAIVLLSAIGFTVSNWMANRKIEALTARLEEIQTRMQGSAVTDEEQARDELERQSREAYEAALVQLSAQVMENSETIKTLQQPAMQNSTEQAAARSKAAAAPSGKPAAAPAAANEPAEQQPEKTAARSVDKATEPPRTETTKTATDRKGKGWSVVLMSLKNGEMADRELAALQSNGIQVEKQTVEVNGETFYQLRAGWFERKDDALQYRKNVIADLGYEGAWVRQTD